MKTKEISSNLFEMQQTKNQGRGVSCIRSVCAYLDLGKVEDAKLIIQHDWDKISNYGDIAKFLKNVMLAERSWYVNGIYD